MCDKKSKAKGVSPRLIRHGGVSRRGFLQGLVATGAVTTFGDVGDAVPAVRFGFITDCHYAAHIETNLLRNYRDGLLKMDAFAAKMNELGADFVVEGGDFKDLGRTPDESLEYLRAIEARFAAFKGPRYHVLGNHDHDNLSKEEFLAQIANEGQDSAKAFYAFTRNGVRFIVLDACYRSDGEPYCRGNFSWADAFVPPEQVEFLKAELAAAKGPCVPIVHHQLDSEEKAYVVKNAAEIRDILEKSGKVKLVVQGHYHEGAFRELNGIGYFTSPASVLHPAPENAFSLVEVFASGGVRITGFQMAKCVETAWMPGDWTADRSWQKGHYQVHYIYTGRSECMFHIFPDGTSMLLDCGDSMRFYRTPAEVPLPSSPSVRAGEFAARYILRVNPKGDRVDYLHLSHYHEDHGGGGRFHGGPLGRSSLGPFNLCGIADAARFLKFGIAVDRAWPGFDEPLDVLKTARDGTPQQMRALYAHLAETQGTQIWKFVLAADDQFRPLAEAVPGFSVCNLCANGRFVRNDGIVRDLYADRVKAGAKTLNENGMSCGMIVEYGKFRYFTAGDFSDGWKHSDGVRHEIEEDLAEVVGQVHVAKLNHHGHHSMYPKLVKALKARVWTNCTLDQQHCTDDTMCRLADRTLYNGPRLMLPTYMPLNRPVTDVGRGYLPDVARCVVDQPCHVVLDVPPGGETYTFSCFSATHAGNPLKGEFGFIA